MTEQSERDIILNSYLNIMDFLAQACGKHCEIVLHAIQDEKASIIAIRNGEISNRKLGKELRPVALKMKEYHESTGYMVNRHEKTLDGRDLKSNTFYIKDSKGNLIGMLCMNFDLTIPNSARKFLEEYMGISKTASTHKDRAASESIKDMTLKMIEEVVRESGVPSDRMTAEEKKAILRTLKEREVFRTKGATRIVAKYLNSSETSIYRYFKELD